MEFYFDFISPYAYLAAERVEELAERNGRALQWRPILLSALLNHNHQRGPAEIPDKRLYTFKNVLRLSHDHGLPLRPPPAHPFNPLLPLRVCTARPEASLILSIYRACWGQGRAIDSAEALADLVDAQTLVQAQSPENKQKLKDTTEQALRKGVFGVPTVVVDDEVFWGFDSFPHLERFLQGRDPIDPNLLKQWEHLPASASRL